MILNFNFKDLGLSHVCSGLSEQADTDGLKTLILANNGITAIGVSYLSKAIVRFFFDFFLIFLRLI
jgi:hypothetical protein